MFRDEIFNLEELERDKKSKKEVDDAVQSSLNSLQKRMKELLDNSPQIKR